MSMTTTRTEKLEIKLTPEEKKRIRNGADDLGIKMAPYARMKILEQTPMVAAHE